jgi:hypothetical protein
MTALTRTLLATLLLFCAHAGAGPTTKTIRIVLLNGNDGKPLPAANDTDGKPVRRWVFIDGQCSWSDPQKRCWYDLMGASKPYDFYGPKATFDDAGQSEAIIPDSLLWLSVDATHSHLKYCQPVKATGVAPEPDAPLNEHQFKIDGILTGGIVEDNFCNTHLNIRPQPGTLIIFMRPLTWSEELDFKLKNAIAPRM